ncbi:MAG: class I SAM-dependent DNA methyltransferase, partial [Sedimentisphaerales bacterium]|nr:class I SAM-dependent DNA methyltransferase [Sedimentisphaerales bacterium]
MAISWNEIKHRAMEFSREWADESREQAEAKSFWDGFFHVFGISRRRVAGFEEPVKKLNDNYGFIDLFWKGVLLVEHKSKGRSLDKAYSQALGYFEGLKDRELPKYVLVSDFGRFRLYNLDDKTQTDFELAKLHKNVNLFGFIAGYTQKKYKDEEPVNVAAAEKMGKLHDGLLAGGYTGHELEVLLMRLLFCLFADDTAIFNKNIFTDYIRDKTNEDGSDLGAHLTSVFQTLNTEPAKRQKNLDESLDELPYVNGGLFREMLRTVCFDSDLREALLECCDFDWGNISPAIFGSMFQSVMNPRQRREIGAHYTTEKNILKLIEPLFLDELRAEFEHIRNLKTGKNKRLEQFHKKLATLKFFDPACGCGNFLIITYRELRRLEIEILKEIHRHQQLMGEMLSLVNVEQFYGIEIEEFPARIAETAMWLMDHQMNVELSIAVNVQRPSLPLVQSAHILNDNALQVDWTEFTPKDEIDYILGNPPFIGKHLQGKEQNSDMSLIFDGVKNYKSLDYVSAWYIKAAQYIQGTQKKVAFVSTNSITMGEQAGILWNELFNHYNIKIHFAHRTFSWSSEARGKAAVHVVIIGFAAFDTDKKTIFEYEDIKGEPHQTIAVNINQYLLDTPDVLINNRSTPLGDVPPMQYGSKPVDDGNLLLSEKDKEELLSVEPDAKDHIKPLISAKEFLNGKKRWCLWLENISPTELKHMPAVLAR